MAMPVMRPEFTGRSGRLKKNWMSLFFIFRPSMALMRAISSSLMLRLAMSSPASRAPAPRLNCRAHPR